MQCLPRQAAGQPSAAVSSPNTSLSEETLRIHSHHSSARTLVWNTLFPKTSPGYVTLNSPGKMALPEPRESQIKAAGGFY